MGLALNLIHYLHFRYLCGWKKKKKINVHNFNYDVTQAQWEIQT